MTIPARHFRFPMPRPEAAAMVLTLAGGPLFVAAAESALPRHASRVQPAVQPSNPDRLFEALANAAAEPRIRRAAADELIELAESAGLIPRITAILADRVNRQEASDQILDAIARSWRPPQGLYQPVLELAQGADAAAAARSVSALGAYRTPSAFEKILECTEPDKPDVVRAAAFSALANMTGRDEMGSDRVAWAAWFERHRNAEAPDWNDALARGVWRRSLRLQQDRRTLVDALVDRTRRLYLALPANPMEERARLLAQAISGSQPELRSLALEILDRELAAGSPVNSEVTQAVVRLLNSREQAVRAKAAAVLVQLSWPDAGPRFAEALSIEQDRAVAQQLLAGIYRWPSPAAKAGVMHWLTDAAGPSAASIDAAWALYDDGYLNEPQDQRAALEVLRKLKPEQLSPAACRLLAGIGEATDRNTLVGVLRSGPPAIRNAAAESLLAEPLATDAILSAAAGDPALFAAAVESVRRHRPTLAGYEHIKRLTAPSPAAHRESLLRLAGNLTTSDLLAAARAQDVSPEMRDSLLSSLTEYSVPRVGLHADPGSFAAAILLLARTRLDLRRPDLALNALDAMPVSIRPEDAAEATRLRTIALLWTNRIEQAASETGAAAAAWLEGLQAAIAEPHARAISRALKARFAGELTPEEEAQFDLLMTQIKQSSEEDTGQSPVNNAGDGS